ncbi:coiled-coil domain-containing protein [Plantactinospora sp. WMMC1484]|uniref:coiled-coil domain-containing protein n=1 Tax=Plantactinospora sp. WMMC1484 TaxID=3404122 RepID=UPI003BF5FF52
MRAPLRRRLATALALLTAAALVVVPSEASAAPKPAPQEEADSPLLGDVLASAGKRLAEAKAELTKSKKRQAQLGTQLRQAEARLAALAPEASEIAAASYRSGKLSAISMLLGNGSAGETDSFIERMSALNELNLFNNSKLRSLNEAREQVGAAKKAIDDEVAKQAAQEKVIKKQQTDAQKALSLVGGRSRPDKGLVSATSPVARPGPGMDDGFPSLPCNKDDPTTGGCITARTLHMYNEVRRAGFKRFVGCFRPGGPFEHPKGRACDWSLRNSGFSRAANDDQMRYGNDLAAFLIRNSDRLGILYVIWYREIWFPGEGWRSYSGPSDHTDHVHVSML